MALVVEDGTGLSTAEAYVSVADTDTYLAAHGRTKTAWDALAEADQEDHLRNATRYIDQMFRARFTGIKGSLAQTLQWPRSSATQDDYALDTNVIPQALKDATSEAALRDLTETNGLQPDISTPGNLKAKTIKAGSVTIEKEWTSGSSPLAVFQVIQGLLGPLLTPAGTVVRG